MLASILRRHAGEAGALATRGNLNTDIGVPLTLLGLRASHRYCAVELGMNHPGEIALLAEIARPTIALVNNAQREHLEFMKSVEAAAEENASVFGALPADGHRGAECRGRVAAMFRRRRQARQRVEFGLERGDVTGRYALKPLRERDRADDAGGRGAGDARDSRACTTCAMRSPPRPARMPPAFRRRRSAPGWPRSGPTAGGCR